MFGDGSNTRAVVIPLARVDNVSVATADMLVSPPTPLALLGLARRMDLDLQEAGLLPPGQHVFRSVVFVVHDFEIAPGHRRIPPEMKGEAGNKAGAMIDDPEGHLLCTIILCADLGDAGTLEAIRAYLARNIRRYRLGGGRIIRAGSPLTPDALPGRVSLGAVETAWDEDAFQRIVRALPPGVVLADRTHMLAPNDDVPAGRDALDRLLDFVAVVKQPAAPAPSDDDSAGEADPAMEAQRARELVKAGKWRWGKNDTGWLKPVAVGWRALSTVCERPGMRGGAGVIGHVWAEDILGLGEWVSLRRALRRPVDGDRGVSGTAWAYQPAPPQGPYLVVGGDF